MLIIIEHESERGRDEAIEGHPAVEEWPHTDVPMSMLTEVNRMWTDKAEKRHFEMSDEAEIVLSDVADVVEVDH